MTNKEFDEILERTNAVVCNREWYERAVKALEQEPSEDAVDRINLLKKFEDRFVELQKIKHLKDNKGAEDRQLGVNWCINILKEMPPVTPTQRWIPVSERLPKPGEYIDDVVAKYYLVQNEYGDMLVARYTHSEYWEQIYRMEPIDDEIVAWMPLPKQYKAEMESNACKDCYYNDGEVHAECVVCGKAEMESEE